VSAIHRSLATAERRLHIEPADVQLNGKAAVTKRPAARFRQKVAEGSAQVVYQRFLPSRSTHLRITCDPVEDPAVGRSATASSPLPHDPPPYPETGGRFRWASPPVGRQDVITVPDFRVERSDYL
jgi:hypothetical protein